PPAVSLEVLGDPNRLKQVFINIIDNAVKYTHSGGQVLISQVKEEGCVRISIADTGIGIPAADIDRVKEKFYKATNAVRGSGIGLAVADEIIKQHKGLLFIESTEGAGTTVTIVLPLYEPENEKKEKTNELPQNTNQGEENG
ncbi:MAG: sensor histidine kinase, partial [Acutalibacteraceae bacterium]